MHDRNELLGEMSIKITVGTFHDIHDKAHQAEQLVNGSISGIETTELLEVLTALKEGQWLTDGETGPDACYAHSYRDSINKIESEIGRRR